MTDGLNLEIEKKKSRRKDEPPLRKIKKAPSSLAVHSHQLCQYNDKSQFSFIQSPVMTTQHPSGTSDKHTQAHALWHPRWHPAVKCIHPWLAGRQAGHPFSRWRGVTPHDLWRVITVMEVTSYPAGCLHVCVCACARLFSSAGTRVWRLISYAVWIQWRPSLLFSAERKTRLVKTTSAACTVRSSAHTPTCARTCSSCNYFHVC